MFLVFSVTFLLFDDDPALAVEQTFEPHDPIRITLPNLAFSFMSVIGVVFIHKTTPIAASPIETDKTLPIDGDRPITSDNLETPDMI